MEIVKQLESASKILLAPPNIVTQAKRQEAEEILLAFRRSKFPYETCRDILEKSEIESVQFQAATTLKEAIIREWNILDSETKLSLQQFVLNYVSNKANIIGFVREALCVVLAVMLKRSSLENNDLSNRVSFYQHLASMISSKSFNLEQTACSILSAVCTEFSASDKSTNVGLTWEHHVSCKKIFEENDLIQIFHLTLQVLRFIESSLDVETTKEKICLCEKVIVVTEQILTWQFSPNTYFRRHGLFHDSTIKLSFKPTKKWASIVFDPNLLQLFFKLHIKVRHVDSVCHGSINCLSQLASLNGPIFGELGQATSYLTNFIQGFLHTFYNGKLEHLEVLGVANTFRNLTEAHKIQIWAMLPREQNIFFSFLQLVTQITCMFAVEAVQKEKEEMVDESEIFVEAHEIMLDAIMSLVQGMDEEDKKSFATTCAAPIIDSFIHCHLSPPDGIRKLSSNDTEDEIDELDENDIDKFACQLMLIGGLARTTCHTVLPMLCKLIEDRTVNLDNQIHQVNKHDSVNVNALLKNVLADIYEDLHWLVLLSGHILADECDGETALIPQEIIKYSISQKGKIDENITLRVLGSPKEKICEIPGADTMTDYVIRMVSSIIKLSQVETNTLQSLSICIWSPQMSQDIIWFFKTWVNSYLLFDEQYYEEFSPVFSSSFGHNSDGAKWLIEFIVSKIINTVTVWSSEIDLLLETCDLLHILVDHDHRCSILVECGEFWTFCKQFCSNIAPFDCLPNYIKQKIMCSIVIVGSTKMNLYKDDYWKQTLEPLKIHYKDLVSQEWFLKVALEDKTRQDISSFLILIQGVAIASRPNNSSVLFTYLASVLQDCPNLFNIYHNFDELTITILEVFVEVAHKQICYLKKFQCAQFFECSMHLLQIYQKHKLTKRSFETEESLQDITLVIELLTHLLSKDFIDFEEPECDENLSKLGSESGSDYPLAVDVVLYGLSITLPFVTSQLLLHPSFCSQYYKLVTFLCELFPEKVEKLPKEMQQFFIQSLQVGLSIYGPDNCKLCLEAVEGLASHCFNEKNPNSSLHEFIPSFIRLVFDSLIVHSGDMEMLRPAGETFYVLLCYQPQFVVEMFHQVRCVSTTSATFGRKLTFPRMTQDNVNLQKRLEIKYSRDYIQHKVEEYNLGARRLARMMGQDPDTFTEEDVKKAISYLFPSDLFSPSARPQMQHPREVYPIARELEVDAEGRPSDPLFYTKFSEIYSVMSEAHRHLIKAQQLLDEAKSKNQPPPLQLDDSRWMTIKELESLLLPLLPITQSLYESFITQMDRLVEERYACEFKDFIMKYRVLIPRQVVDLDDIQIETDEQGRKFTCADGNRKTALATVRLTDQGEGRVTVNGLLMQDFFNMIQDRECLLTPLVFVRMLPRFDVEATVDGGFAGNWSMLNGSVNEYAGTAKSAMAGAIRLALAKALVPFVSEEKAEQMRRAGLLSYDPRRRERKKPGQKKARKKFTWKKR